MKINYDLIDFSSLHASCKCLCACVFNFIWISGYVLHLALWSYILQLMCHIMHRVSCMSVAPCSPFPFISIAHGRIIDMQFQFNLFEPLYVLLWLPFETPKPFWLTWYRYCLFFISYNGTFICFIWLCAFVTSLVTLF